MVGTIRRGYFGVFAVLVAMALLGVLAGTSGAAAGDTTRVSVASDGTQAESASQRSPISSDGRYVAFQSWASNLVEGDTNGVVDIFVRDRDTDADGVFDEAGAVSTERVSVDSSGAQVNGDSSLPRISADGRFVAFKSAASNLVEGDTNGVVDVFVHDRQTGETQRVSERVSKDESGNRVVTEANDHSNSPSISADGRFVAFNSVASNLVEGDTNDVPDVFVRDLRPGEGQTETLWRVSLNSSGAEANGDSSWSTPSISSDGRFVAFSSEASNLVAGDTNGADDVFVRDRTAETTRRVSTGGYNGDSYAPSISADGRFVAFTSNASTLVSGDTNSALDVFVYDRGRGTTERVSMGGCGKTQGNSHSSNPSISADGNYVAFISSANNLVKGDTNGYMYDAFVYDRQTKETQLVSVGRSGAAANSESFEPSVSSDGSYVTFSSAASNLVVGDTNNSFDIFMYERKTSDCTAPTTTHTVSPPPDTNGWNISNVTVTLEATDNDGGSGIKQINYSINGGANQTYTSTDKIPLSSEGTTTIRYFATDNAGNQESPKTLTVKIDKTPPKVNTVYPANGANNVGRSTNPLAWLSENVAPASVTTATFKLYQCSSTRDVNCTTQVTSGTTVTPSTSTASLDPYGSSSTLLASKTKYKAVITTGVTDEAGNALDQDPSAAGNQEKVWYFTTGSR